MGVSGCGKSEVGSRLANALGYPFIEGDEAHPPSNIAKMAQGIPLNDNDRLPWLLSLQARIEAARAQGAGLVLACSALKKAYRDLLRAADANLVFVHVDGEPRLIAERLLARQGHFMSPGLLESQMHDLEPLTPAETGMQIDIKLSPAQQIDEILLQASSIC